MPISAIAVAAHADECGMAVAGRGLPNATINTTIHARNAFISPAYAPLDQKQVRL
jgi:hypothetical protein